MRMCWNSCAIRWAGAKDLLLPEDVKAAPKPRKPRGTGKAAEAVEPAPSAPLNEQETEAMRALLEEMHQAAPEAEKRRG